MFFFRGNAVLIRTSPGSAVTSRVISFSWAALEADLTARIRTSDVSSPRIAIEPRGLAMRRLAFGSTLYVCSITSLAASSVLGLGLQPSKARSSHNAAVICRTAIRILIFIRRLGWKPHYLQQLFLDCHERDNGVVVLTVVLRRENEMIVWAGSGSGYLNTGARYNPSTDSWRATNAPTGRYGHTAVWTGNEMIAWGGYRNSSFLNTGGSYCAQFGPTPTPTPTPTTTPRLAPTPRLRPAPVPRP